MATYEEVKKSFQQVKEQLQDAWQRERPLSLEQVKELIAEFEFTPEELGLAEPKRARIVKQRYRDPNGVGGWNGHGRQPGWFKQRLEEGFDIESLIDRSGSAS